MPRSASPSNPAQQSRLAPQPSPAAPATSGNRHSHARSKSVNLSPTISDANSPYASVNLRWDEMPSTSSSTVAASSPSSSSSSSSSRSSRNSSTSSAQLGSPLLRASSPRLINANQLRARRLSAGYSGMEAGGVQAYSPESRQGAHAASGMNRSLSNGSLNSHNVHLSPHSPRSSHRRTASPARAYAIPLSPRLQAFGAGHIREGGHNRRASAGPSNHLLTADPIPRSISPLAGLSGQEYDEAPNLPIDSVWPDKLADDVSVQNASGEAIPLGSSKGRSTPVPPSLREDFLSTSPGTQATAIPFPGSSSPRRNLYYSSQQGAYYSHGDRDQRTPSPSAWSGGRQEKRPATSPNQQHAKLSISPSSSYSPLLAAPRAISRRALDLDKALTSQAFSSSRRHRTTSNSSDESSGSVDSDAADEQHRGSRHENDKPTSKALSPVAKAQAKIDTQHALAVGSAQSGELYGETSREHVKDGLDPHEPHHPIDVRTGGRQMSRSSSLTSLRPAAKAAASIANLPHGGSPSSVRPHTLSGRAMSSPSMNGGIAIADGGILRARSPAIAQSSLDLMRAGESPPKTRSFIGMPPRSGYDLSDDPDDVGSDNGSTGSGRESVDTTDDGEEDDMEGDNHVDGSYDSGEEDGDASYPGPSLRGVHEGNDSAMDVTTSEPPQMLSFVRPGSGPRRPSLTHSNVVSPAPPPLPPQRELDMQWQSAGGSSSISPSPRIEIEGSEMSPNGAVDEDQEGIDLEGQDTPELADQEVTAEESLSTLEKIFLFAKSEMTYHRVLVSRSLSEWIMDVELSDAVEFVIPLLNGLACDETEVCAAFAPQLHKVIWHFFRNCPLTDDQVEEQGEASEHSTKEEAGEMANRPRISISVFTPMLCAMLLNSNATIASSTQSSIIHLFARLHGFTFADADVESDQGTGYDVFTQQRQQQQQAGDLERSRSPFNADASLISDAASREKERVLLQTYDFPENTRSKIMEHILHNVALAIGDLKAEGARNPDEGKDGQQHLDSRPSSDHGEDVQTPTGDANMEEIPLHSADESSDGKAVQAENKEEDFEMQGDVEMPLYASEEGRELGIAGSASIASMGDVSMTMSDVEEEVAVGRMASMSLLAALGADGLVSQEFLKVTIVEQMLRFAADPTFFVRKEVAVAIGVLAKKIGSDTVEERSLLNVYESFCNDRIWHVRQAACLSLPNLSSQLTDRALRRSKVIALMRLFVDDVSVNVRVAALDIIGETIYLFYDDPEGVPPELVRHFLWKPFDLKEGDKDDEDASVGAVPSSRSPSSSSAGDSDAVDVQDHGWTGMRKSISTTNANGPSGWSNSSYSAPTYQSQMNNFQSIDMERPLVMAYNFPAVLLTLGKEEWPRLREAHSQLCSDTSSKVRRSLASSLHEIAKILGQERTSEDLLAICRGFLDSEHEQEEEVKMAMLSNLDILLENCTIESGLETLRFLMRLWNEEGSSGDPSQLANNWRLREKLISLIPALAKRFLLEDDDGMLVILMQSAIMDPVSAVRDQGFKVVGPLYHIFEEHDQVLADGFLGMLVDVGEGESYRARVACLHCLMELCKAGLQRSSVEMMMMSRLTTLSKDEVVDVRIVLAQVVATMCSIDGLYAMPNSRSTHFSGIIRRLARDPETLVRETTLSVSSSDDVSIAGSVDEGSRRDSMAETTPKEPKQLILGPSGGGPHRIESQRSSYAVMQGFERDDDTDEEQSQEERVTEEGEGGEQSQRHAANDRAQPTALPLHSSAIHRRTMNRHQSLSQHSDMAAGSSMFDDADEDGEEDSDGYDPFDDQYTPQDQRGWRIHQRSEKEDTGDDSEVAGVDSVTPEEDTASRSSGTAESSSLHQLKIMTSKDQHEDALADENDAPHHLLGVEDQSTPTRPFSTSSFAHGLSLESPERPWQAQQQQQHHDDKGVGMPNGIDGSHESPAATREGGKSEDKSNAAEAEDARPAKAHDPFLAFVADKRFEQEH